MQNIKTLNLFEEMKSRNTRKRMGSNIFTLVMIPETQVGTEGTIC